MILHLGLFYPLHPGSRPDNKVASEHDRFLDSPSFDDTFQDPEFIVEGRKLRNGWWSMFEDITPIHTCSLGKGTFEDVYILQASFACFFLIWWGRFMVSLSLNSVFNGVFYPVTRYGTASSQLTHAIVSRVSVCHAACKTQSPLFFPWLNGHCETCF